MEKELLSDIIEWDIENWSKALPFWEVHLPKMGGTVLELGARGGGISLWFAQKGFDVVCSDFQPDFTKAKALHVKYGVQSRLSYQDINAAGIPYSNHFDVVVFKSILGSISGSGRDALKGETFRSIHRALKPGGVLLFAENLDASTLHRFARKRFVRWGKSWNYLKFDEFAGLLSDYNSVSFQTTGFFTAFGRSERQRRLLSRFDQAVKFFIPKDWRYILMVAARK